MTRRGGSGGLVRWPLVGAVLALLVVPASVGTAGGDHGHPPRPPKPPTAVADAGRPTVGALFMDNGAGPHFCTATVIASRHRNLLLTAAHCMFENETGPPRAHVAFVPGYQDGQRPYGTWPVREVVVSPQWRERADPDHDVAVLVVDEGIEDRTGAQRLLLDSRREQVVEVLGYPVREQRPVTCRNWTAEFSRTQRGFDCRGYLTGTSGGPWLTARGEVVGLVGGFQFGGDEVLHNYSPYLGDQARALYERAQQVRPGAGGGR
ncbi:trypsin-like peptidase domain-containing protein [Crossiella sp. SN42]|uniref:trypsin-like serine peptidase n=1 Tax=Crossiella sp. SN42 TaxID=2944808 RepID=UPI00207D3E1D|nr:trypsin-like peptidase domain-containing protein [Crossiella sp. SN42]MCO1582495.1 trypsin-like peptidase domain-containing protein [Crossiella sp. SN42]